MRTTIDISIDADWNALYVDGEWVESAGEGTIAVEGPLDARTVAHVARGTEADVDAAYEAAAAAKRSGPRRRPSDVRR